MSLDDDIEEGAFLSQMEQQLRADWEADQADRKAAWDERDLCESVEAMETHWRGVMAQGKHSLHADQHWSGT